MVNEPDIKIEEIQSIIIPTLVIVGNNERKPLKRNS